MIAVALLVGILIATIASQGHLNPAVSIMEYMNGKIDNNELCGYISAQLVGVVLALTWYKYSKSKNNVHI
jgi:glycerol uptake facilitator-like aquaporin